MNFLTEAADKLFSITESSFEELALEVFHFQALHVPLYREYLDYLHTKPGDIQKVEQIPFLPIELFRKHKVIVENSAVEAVFESSGTTGAQRSRHYVANLDLYERSAYDCFHFFFGRPEEYVFLALLPSYLERTGSSLVYMVNYLMTLSRQEENGFFLDDFLGLQAVMKSLEAGKKRSMLFGVSFALLDFFAAYPMELKYTSVLETGGMKGRKKEMIRQELHEILCRQTHRKQIYSEYGMTELLSQAYSLSDGIFRCPPWMQVMIREADDPFSHAEFGHTGGINIIDLANLYSCSFIATQDLGRKYADGRFEVLGRFGNADIRGCSLLYE